MPINATIDKKNDLVLRTVQGLVSTEDLLKNIENILNHPDFHPGMKSLTDLREATHHVKAEDIRRLAKLFSSHVNKLEEGKAAVVVSKSVSYGMMRMLQAYADDSPLAIEIFYEIEDAKHWLGIQT